MPERLDPLPPEALRVARAGDLVETATAVGAQLFRGEVRSEALQPLLVDALANATSILESSANLQNWSPIQTNTANSQGQILFQDPPTPPSARRFCRALWP